MVEKSLAEYMPFEQRPEESEGVSLVNIWGNTVQSRGNSQSGAYLENVRNSKEVAVAGTK